MILCKILIAFVRFWVFLVIVGKQYLCIVFYFQVCFQAIKVFGKQIHFTRCCFVISGCLAWFTFRILRLLFEWIYCYVPWEGCKFLMYNIFNFYFIPILHSLKYFSYLPFYDKLSITLFPIIQEHLIPNFQLLCLIFPLFI